MTGTEIGVDLHLHSVFSDGLKTPSELCGMAASMHIQWAALCDHDTLSGQEEMRLSARKQGLNVLTGVEVSTGEGGRTHLLCYVAHERSEALAAYLSGLASDRRERSREILSRLSRLGAGLPEALAGPLDAPNTGRAHIARALVKSGAVKTVSEAFDRYLGEGCPAYVPRRTPPTGEAIRRLSAMGAVVVLAHPMRLGLTDEALLPLIAEWKAAGLRGLEAFHPSASAQAAKRLERLARREGLLVTGGSDYHGDENTRSRVGRLPSGWHSREADVLALAEAVACA